MSTTLLPYPTQTSGGISAPDWLQRFRRRPASTNLYAPAISPEVAAFVDSWDGGTQTTASAPHLPRTAIEAVDFIAAALHLPRTTVLEAVSVPEKTFYNWVRDGNVPRPASTQSLWRMTRVVHTLAEAHPDLAAWYHSSDDAQRAFAAGDSNALATEAATWVIRRSPVQIRLIADHDFGHAADIDTVEPRKRIVSQPVPATPRRERSDGR